MFTNLTRPAKARTPKPCLSSPAFPGMLPHAQTYAAWPVWSDSTTAEARFEPMPKRKAVQLWHDARRFERQTRGPGKQDGALGRNGLAVLHALLFDFLNFRSGALYPSWAAIAEAACISESSVGRGLARLKAAGVLSWLRRAVAAVAPAGGFLLRQISNAYHVCSTAGWKGYRPPPLPPPPAPGTWGDHPSMGSALDVAAALKREGASLTARIEAMEGEPGNALAAALARLGRAVTGRKP
jgi:hypothetical protein